MIEFIKRKYLRGSMTETELNFLQGVHNIWHNTNSIW